MEKDNLNTILFANETQEVKDFLIDSMKNTGQLTDISKAIRRANLNAVEDNVCAALLITDGAFNTGNNPLYDAAEFGKPIYVIGVGDSSEPRDISIQSIIVNDIVYMDNPAPININVKINGYSSGEVKVTLSDNGNHIAEQVIKINTDKQSYSTIFEYKPTAEGMHKITASCSPLAKELTLKNNTLSEFIKVLKSKRHIAIFAGAPSPDLSFIRIALSQERGIEVMTYIQKKESDYYEHQPNQADIREAEIIVLLGFPVNSTPSNIMQMLSIALESGKPVLFIASQATDYVKLRMLEGNLPFNYISSGNQEYFALADIKPQSMANPLLRISGVDEDIKLWNSLPPLFRTETFVRIKPESEIVMGIKVNNVPMKEPLVLMREFQEKKSVAVLGYGLYRWKLLGYANDIAKGKTDAQDLYSIFIRNSIKWLSVTDRNKLVTIKTNKKLYINNEKVEFIGQVYDGALTPIDNARITIKISGGKTQREVSLTNLGNGRYGANVDGLPQGDFIFSGEAFLADKLLGADTNRFSIGDLNIEYQNLKMNVALLRSLAERSGGKFYTPSEAGKFLNDLRKNNSFIQREVTLRNEYALWNLPWILALSIFFFAFEWALRKKYGLL
ncbi:MAG: hypothetical protein HW421_2967 [Ignavibacteria bacterium]|nr:hypothetical protein [Ignavibacteria bacterium]